MQLLRRVVRSLDFICFHKVPLIVNESYSERGIIVQEMSYIVKGCRPAGRPWLIHAECANSSDCDRATAQWPDAEERARVVLGSLESPSGDGSYIRHSDQTNCSDHKSRILLVSSIFKDAIPRAEIIQQRIKWPGDQACIVKERKRWEKETFWQWQEVSWKILKIGTTRLRFAPDT
jgi:hypothetical protein